MKSFLTACLLLVCLWVVIITAGPDISGKSRRAAARKAAAEELAVTQDPSALRFGAPTQPAAVQAREAAEPTFANFGPDLQNQLLSMAAIVAAAVLISLRKRGAASVSRGRGWR